MAKVAQRRCRTENESSLSSSSAFLFDLRGFLCPGFWLSHIVPILDCRIRASYTRGTAMLSTFAKERPMQALWIGLLAWEIAAMPPPADEIVDRFEAKDFTLGSGDEKVVFHYRLLKPTKIEPGKQYPLVLFLHGAGERGDDNKMQLLYFPELMASDANREKYPCFLLAPQCREGKKWVDVDWGAPKSSPQSDLGEEARAVLGMLEETERKYPVDRIGST